MAETQIDPAEVEVEKVAMVLVRVDRDFTEDEDDLTPPVDPGTYVGAVIVGDDAWYWHPVTGEPWVSKSGAYTIQHEGGAL